MTEVCFYILQDHHLSARDHFTCRLAEKAMRSGAQVVIHVQDKQQADDISECLWRFKPEAFVPHYTSDSHCLLPAISIDWQENWPKQRDILINLRSAPPKGFNHFKRLLEVVVQNDEQLPASRERFLFYRQQGYPPQSHTIA